MVTGHSELTAMLCGRTSSARPWVSRVMPNLEIDDVPVLAADHGRQHGPAAQAGGAGVDA
jgi:hypothetical protein